jgi:iron complex outermembrane receptor protein
MKCKLLTILLFGWTFSSLTAQEVTVTGKVTDANDGSPIPGANVIVDGTKSGTVTSVDGSYSIKVSSPSSTLVFSFIGYKSKKVTVGESTQIDVQLEVDVTNLDEVVITGYGTSKKKDITGAIASLHGDDLNKPGATTPEQLLQGKIAGVQIISNNGEPGAGSQIKVRGASTIRANAQPLYIIDGIPMDMQSTSPSGIAGSALGGAPATSPLNSINPADIESVDVLKDASAAAIYGSRAANGVIIITTKKGKEGVSEINYSTSISNSNLPKKLPVASAARWVSYRKDSLNTTAYNFGDNTDWQDQIFRNATSYDHNLSISGGTKKTTYLASLNYTNQEGIIKKSDLKRYNGRVNISQKGLNDHLLIEANINASQIVENRVPVGATGFEGDLLLNALQANPTWPAYDSTGKPFQGTAISPFTSQDRNPIAMLYYTSDLTRTTAILAGISSTLDFGAGFSYKVNFGTNYSNANRLIDQSQKLSYMVSSSGSGQINNKELYNYVVEHTLNFNRTFSIHSINALLGYSYQDFNVRGSDTKGGGYATDGILYTNKIGAGSNAYTTINSYADNYKLQSFFGRVNYNLLERYILTGTLRYDGSSKFGENHKYGTFPSVAFAWRLSEEEFIKSLDFIYNLKLRIGWGQTGNSEIGTKNSQYLYAFDNQSKAIIDGNTIIGLKIARTPNPDLTWETTTSTNIGLDYGFIKGKLSGTIDYFNKTTTDLLLEVPSSPGSPTSTVVKNIDSCKIINKGLELGLTAIPFSEKFSWEITGNITFMSNKVKNLPVSMYKTGAATGQGLTDAYVQIITSNQPMHEFYGYKVDSISSKGTVYYKKGVNKKDTLMYLGSPYPDFTWSLTNTFKYKGFDLNIFIEGVQGNKIFNNTALLLDKTNLKQAKNALNYFLDDRVKVSTYIPKISDRYIEDGSYIRLSNITLGYTYNFKNNLWVKNIRFYVSGSNLLLITNYKGYDPDVYVDKGMNSVSSFGIDITSYPKARTYLMGLNVTF